MMGAMDWFKARAAENSTKTAASAIAVGALTAVAGQITWAQFGVGFLMALMPMLAPNNAPPAS